MLVGIIDEMRLLVVFVTIAVLMAAALMPLDMALGQGTNLTRALPPTVERGQTFNVTVTFTAPADKFNAIGLADNAPDGWDVTIDAMWSNPSADAVLAKDNKAEIVWFGEPGVGFDKGTSFSVLYKVTVPDYACAGKHTFDGFLEYYVGSGGPYSENITGDSEVEVPVAATPLICCNLKNFTFSATEGGSNPADQTLEISNSGVGTINWTLSDNAGWLSENSTSGSSTGEHDTVAVSVDIAGMSPGNYSANITITADGAINSPWTVPVSLQISSAASEISFNPESLSFTAVEGGSNPAEKMLQIWNSGNGTLNWTLTDDAAWLGENPTSGSSTGEHDTVAVSVDITGMSAGDYSGNITITADDASNSPRTVPISLHISLPAPEISLNPESLSFTAVEGGSNPAEKVLEIWNSGVDTLDWSLSDDAAWLGEDPTSGSSTGEHDTVAVLVDIAGMSAGDYSANITITSPGASNSPQLVPVSLHISSAAPEISFTPEILNFTAFGGGSIPPNKTLGIWNSGIEILNWSVSDDAEWLSENPTSGSSTSPYDATSVTVSVNTAGMSDGNYSANITITAPGASNSPQIVPVSLHISSAAPQISFTPEILNFTAVGGGSIPPNKTLGIWNSGIEILNWSVSDDAGWLSENPTSGSSTSPHDTTSVTVSVNTTGMSDGDYSANITITAPGASNSPQTVLVNLYVGQIGPPSPQPWLSRYWWAIVAGIVVVVLLVSLLRRRRRWA